MRDEPLEHERDGYFVVTIEAAARQLLRRFLSADREHCREPG